MKSLFGGSAAIGAAFVLASMLFYANPSIAVTTAPQETKPTQQEKKDANARTIASAGAPPTIALEHEATSSSVAEIAENLTVNALPAATKSAAAGAAEAVLPAAAAQDYLATAYSLPGRGASGKPVARGTIAADPRVLPFGTRVRLDAGPYSGEYVVTDAGSAVKGRKIDVWVPSYREACRFGRRSVRLTVLSYGPKRARR
jgi:3D (Asp-Asp-Asp) domain-containing protein